MRKNFLFVAILLASAAGAFAAPRLAAVNDDLGSQIAAILAQKADTQLGTMTVGELQELAGQISIAEQKAQYVRAAGMASMVLPGVGQLIVGDALGGSLYLLGDIGVLAGTLVGSYFLLPVNVQFGQLDYFTASHSTIRTTWQSNPFTDYLPSLGVVAGGVAVEMVLRWLSSTDAAAAASSNVKSGKVTFEPKLIPLFGAMGQGDKLGAGLFLHMRM
jgi:hypothetical protein